MIGGGIVGGLLFVYIKNKLFSKAKEKVKEVCTPPSDTECFDKNKAIKGLTNVTSPVLWWKDIISIFNLRKLIIVGVIISVIFGYGYWKGLGSAKVLPTTEEWIMKLDGHYLHWDPKLKSMHVQISPDVKSTEQIKVISIKDIPALYAKFKPYGFQLKPVVSLGGGISGTSVKGEIGAGLSWFKWYDWRLNSSITNGGFYPLGVGYKITPNTTIGINGGIGYNSKERERLNFGVMTEF
jgi:hypothetical protein